MHWYQPVRVYKDGEQQMFAVALLRTWGSTLDAPYLLTESGAINNGRPPKLYDSWEIAAVIADTKNREGGATH